MSYYQTIERELQRHSAIALHYQKRGNTNQYLYHVKRAKLAEKALLKKETIK